MWQHLKSKLIRALGGFPTKDEAIDAVMEGDADERRKILTLAVRRLYNTIGPDDILKEVEGQWLIEGKPVVAAIKAQLIQQAKEFQQTKLWELLQRDIKYQANRRMFILGTSDIDLTAGKLWTFTLDAFNTRLKSMIKGSGTFNSDKQG